MSIFQIIFHCNEYFFFNLTITIKISFLHNNYTQVIIAEIIDTSFVETIFLKCNKHLYDTIGTIMHS